jgi:hypothetical protein
MNHGQVFLVVISRGDRNVDITRFRTFGTLRFNSRTVLFKRKKKQGKESALRAPSRILLFGTRLKIKYFRAEFEGGGRRKRVPDWNGKVRGRGKNFPGCINLRD